MVPIHDTDVAEERWSKGEWENYELWEQVEHRLKRKRRYWILGTGVVFLMVSSVPIILDRWPKWVTRTAVRRLAHEINQVKREASIHRTAYRLRIVDKGPLEFQVEKVTSCSQPNEGEPIRSSSLLKDSLKTGYTWLMPSMGSSVGIPGLVREFCYDAYTGSGPVQSGEPVVGFGVVPVKDLAEKRLDRLSVLLLSGPSGENSFD
jgi:hypothetical protein